jgi:hypothetical protein
MSASRYGVAMDSRAGFAGESKLAGEARGHDGGGGGMPDDPLSVPVGL